MNKMTRRKFVQMLQGNRASKIRSNISDGTTGGERWAFNGMRRRLGHIAGLTAQAFSEASETILITYFRIRMNRKFNFAHIVWLPMHKRWMSQC